MYRLVKKGGAAVEAKYIGVQEIADELGLDIQTIRRWIHSGKLPAIKPGLKFLVAREDLDAFLAERSTDPKGAASPSTAGEAEGRREDDLYGPWLDFADRFAERWEARIDAGDVDLGSVDEFIKTVGDLMPTLCRLNTDEQLGLPQQPFSFGVPAAKTGVAITRLSNLVDPLAEALGSKFEGSEFGQRLIRKLIEQEALQSHQAHDEAV